MAALAGELGRDPPDRTKESQSAKELSVGRQRWRFDPARRSLGTKWGKRGRRESNVEGYTSLSRVLDSSDSAACFGPGPTTRDGITRKIERGTSALKSKAPGPKMVASSVGRQGTRIDGRRLGNGGSGESTEEMQQRDPGGHEEEEQKRARPRKKEERKIVLKRANGGVQQQRRRPRKRRRVQGEAHCRHEARSASPLRPDHDATPPGTASRGLRRGGRGASERPGGCFPRDSSEAECWEQAQFQNSSRVAVVSRSRRLADARSSGECRRRPDPKISRSGGCVTGGRGMVSCTPSRSVARSGSLDSAIWSAGSDGQGRMGPSPTAPRSLESEPKAGPRGERAALRPRPMLEERGGRRRRTSSRSTKRPTKRKLGKERPPEGSAAKQPGPRRTRRPEQGKAKQVAVKGKAAPLVVCAAQRASLAEVNLGKELPPHSIYMERSWCSYGTPSGCGNPFKAETCAEQSRAAVVEKYREYLRSPSGRWLRYRLHELVGKKCFCHCSLDEVCHVDEILKVMDDEQKARARDDRPPDLSGMSLAEVGLALKSHLLAPKSESAASVENFVLRHSGLERGGISKDILPFPLSFCPTAAEISLSLEAGRAQLGQGGGGT